MFGFVTASRKELTREQIRRYGSIYCGICRRIRMDASPACRLGLSYDTAFLALLLMSLYEPEEQQGSRPCGLHPARTWVDNEYIAYAAGMNVALAWFKAMDDVADENKGRIAAGIFRKQALAVKDRYPRQWDAMDTAVGEIRRLELAGCDNPDLPAAQFGALLEEITVYRHDRWEPLLRQTGNALGRFIYLADAVADYRRDRKKEQYNPLIAMGAGEDLSQWEEYLVLTMGRCTEAYEKLPLVQDKEILDNILYRGVWTRLSGGKKHDESL